MPIITKERVEELNAAWQKAAERIAALESTLAWYADGDLYLNRTEIGTPAIMDDAGERARRALPNWEDIDTNA